MFRLLKSKLLKSIVVPGITNVPRLATGAGAGAGSATTGILSRGITVSGRGSNLFPLPPTINLLKSTGIRKLLKNVVGGQ
jgi:hypothetical protein